MNELPFHITAICIQVLAFCIHAIGIHCLYVQKRHKLVLINLSVIEIFMTLNLLTLRLLDIAGVGKEVNVHVLAWDGGIDIMFYLIMCLISIDRLLCVLLHIKYNFYMTKKVFKTIIAIIWITGFLIAFPFHFMKHEHTYEFFYHYLYQICDNICIVVAVVSYSIIAYMLKKGRKKRSETLTVIEPPKNPGAKRRVYYIAGWIILTFVLFYYIPDIFLTAYPHSEIVKIASPICWSVGLMTDPLIYIFFDKQCRQTVVELFLRRKKYNIHNYSDSITEHQRFLIRHRTETVPMDIVNIK